MKLYPFNELPKLNNAEVEDGETVQLPNGDMYRFKGNKHSRGGIKTMLPEDSRVFSQFLKLDREVVKEISGSNKAKSPAYLSKKYDPTPYREILLDRSNRTDDLRYSTAQLMASKYSAMQDVVFNAQEGHKDYNKKGKLKMGGKVKYQGGGDTGLDFQVPDSGLRVPGFDFNQPTQFNDSYTTVGLSIPDPNDSRLVQSVYNPLANRPFFTEGTYNQRGQLTGRDGDNLRQQQETLSDLRGSLGLNERLGRQANEEYAFELRKSMQADPDKNIRAEVIDPVTRQRIPVAQATDEQIRASNGELHFKNLRTGQNDIVDGRNGNLGEGTTDNNFFLTTNTSYKVPHIKDTPLDSLPLPNSQFNKPFELPSKDTTLADDTFVGGYDDGPYPYEEEVPIGINPEQLLSGIQAGLDIAGLATLERGVPNYNYIPTQVATTRFDPINQLSQDRAFNIAKEALDRSNLPEQVKQAQLNQLQANSLQGRNQTDLTNYQGDLQNDNFNTQQVTGAINQNRFSRVNANQAYAQELSRAKFNEQAQKQTYIDSLLNNYRTRQENKMNLGLVNQLSRNYNFSNTNNKVNFTPGQGYNQSYDQLSPFQTKTQ